MYTVINAYIKKKEKSQINGLTLYLDGKKKEQIKPKVKEIRKGRSNRDYKDRKINETELIFWQTFS